MEQSLDDLEDLADSIGSSNLQNGKVNLEKIIYDQGIRLIYGNYGQGFMGQLVHENGNFYIHVNMDALNLKNPGRIRYTIAHELGHYFNDGHRTRLANGESISYQSDYTCSPNPKEEKAANHFGSFLLMPKDEFLKTAAIFEPGLPAILALKDHFETSVESTATRYVVQNLAPCMIIKWDPDFKFNRAFYSKSFSDLTGIRDKPAIKVTRDYIRDCLKQVHTTNVPFFETATQLSKWVASISPMSKNDFVGLEQTIKLGSYGALTALTFSQ